MMAEKPILFNTEMVRAILDGRKTQTRRLVKPQPKLYGNLWELGGAGWSDSHIPIHPVPGHSLWNLQQVIPGDILWVRETWHGLKTGNEKFGHHKTFWYKADEKDENPDDRWRPSIHMPKDAARLFLRVTDVRMEQLQDISPSDIDAEGCKEYAYNSATGELLPSGPTWFKILWDKTIKPVDLPRFGWDANPWVWVIEFENVSAEYERR